MSVHKDSMDQAYQCLLSIKNSHGMVKNPVIAIQCKYKLAYKKALCMISHLEKHELVSRPLKDSPNTRLILDPCGENTSTI